MNKQDLISKIKQLDGISQDERAYLINLVNTKKYGLVWEDKPEDVEEQLRDNLPVLREVVEKRILAPSPLEKAGDEAPNHILIEGDNLHSLTALTFTHEGKVDVIYIDPPYNTGNKDFKYNDTFVDKEDSYRHSKWLSFMDKRLRIAKRLLSETGIIFISIDDNENAQLKLLCDEIIGEKNLISDVIWQSRKSVSNDTFVSLNHNYTLIYAKDISLQNKNDFRLTAKIEKFSNPDNDERGPWVADPFDAPQVRKNLEYPIQNINTGEIYLPANGRHWRTTQEEYNRLLADNKIIFGKNGKSKPQFKRFLSDAEAKGASPISIWNDIETTTNGTQQLEDILGSKLFTNPKPLGLLDRILKLSTNNNKTAKVLDFFAGSGTTLHATMALNAEDGGNRQSIIITNNEIDAKTEKDLLEKGLEKGSEEFETYGICQSVTYERNKRVIEGYTNAKGVAVAGLKNNNLRYFKSEFVPSSKTEQNKRLLTQASTELICIKEDCYQDITSTEGFNRLHCSIFTNNSGKYLVVVYHSRQINEVCEQLTNYIKGLETTEKVKLYAFSPEKETLLEDFYDVQDKIDAVPLPEAIYNAYRATFRTLKLDKKPVVVSTPTDDVDGESTLFDNQDEE